MHQENYVDLLGNGLYYPTKDRGVLITGFPGAGKSTIALELVNNHGFLHIGDDIVSYNTETRSISWGCPALGPFKAELRPAPGTGESLDQATANAYEAEIPAQKRIASARLSLAIKLSRDNYPTLNFDAGFRMLETLQILHKEKVKIKEVKIKESDIKRTIEDVLKLVC